jgi:hypothetical protein
MPNPFRFPSNLILSLCSALLPLSPCVALPQITNVTEDQSMPTPTAGRNCMGLVREAVSPANGSVSFRLDMGGVA